MLLITTITIDFAQGNTLRLACHQVAEPIEPGVADQGREQRLSAQHCHELSLLTSQQYLGRWLLRAAPQHDKFCIERFKSALKIQLLADVEAVTITEISDSIADALPSHVL